MTSFGEWFREQRKRIGKTQQDVAALAGVSISVVTSIETDKPTGPRGRNRSVLSSLAQAVGVDAEEMYRQERASRREQPNGTSRASAADMLTQLQALARAHPAIRLADALALVKDRGGMPLREAAMPVPKGGMDMPGGKKK